MCWRQSSPAHRADRLRIDGVHLASFDERHLAQPTLLKLKLFQPSHLIRLQAAELLPPTLERDRAPADLADGIGHIRPLRDLVRGDFL